MAVTRETLDAIVKDRTSIIADLIVKATDGGILTAGQRDYIEHLAGLVFYEPGWEWRLAEQVTGRPEFFVTSYNPSDQKD